MRSHALEGTRVGVDWRWQETDPEEEFILVIDADMIMRTPFNPVTLGAKPGTAISAFFGYMKGVSNELALKHVPQVVPRNDSLAGPPGRRGDQVINYSAARVDIYVSFEG